MPADLRDATIVALYKNKGAKADCGNYRGISLLSIAGKILARILLNRLIENTSEDNLPEAQCGFRPGRSTIDMVFTVRKIQEKCSEQQMDLHAVFIDLTKAFDTVNREALWSVLLKLGCPRKFTTLIRLFHDNMTGQVLSNGEHSNIFAISNGVKQGCVLAPVLFNLFFTQVLLHAVKDQNLGFYIKYRLDGSLFDQAIINRKFTGAICYQISRLSETNQYHLTSRETNVLLSQPITENVRRSFNNLRSINTLDDFKCEFYYYRQPPTQKF